MNSLAGLFQFMMTGTGKMTVMGIERKCKSHISISEEKDKARVGVEEDMDDTAEDSHEPVLTTRTMTQDTETDM